MIQNFLAEPVQKMHMTNKPVQYDLGELWIYIKCNNFNYLDIYNRYLQNCSESWYCIEYCTTTSFFKKWFWNIKIFALKRTKRCSKQLVIKTYTKFKTFSKSV